VIVTTLPEYAPNLVQSYAKLNSSVLLHQSLDCHRLGGVVIERTMANELRKIGPA